MFILKKIMEKSIIVKGLAIVLVAATVKGIALNKNFVKSKADGSDNDQSFSDDTIVTEDNILEILDFLNIEHGGIEYVDGVNAAEYTVGELKEALGRINFSNDLNPTEVKENTYNLSISFQELDDGVDEVDRGKDKIKNKTLTRSFPHDDYEIEYSVDVKWNSTKKAFIETTGQDVDVDSDGLIFSYKISSKNLSSSCTKDQVTLKAKFKLKTYLGIGDHGLIEIASQKVESTVYWYAK